MRNDTEFGSGPRPRGAAGGWTSSAACVVGDVAVDEAPGDGVVERGADDGVDLEDRFRCEPVPITAAVGGEGVVEGVEVISTQAAQRDVTDGGSDVAVDEPRVPVGGGGADLAALVRDPRVGAELAQRHRPCRHAGCDVAFVVEARGELFGFFTVVADTGCHRRRSRPVSRSRPS